jgi:hypothetical protein
MNANSPNGIVLETKSPELSAALPAVWANYRLGAVMLVGHLPSANEVKRGGKNVARFREWWRSLPASFAVQEPSLVHRFPGSKLHALVAFSSVLPASLRTYGDLLHLPIGRWFDLQVVDRDRIVAYTIRENGELSILPTSSKFSVEEAYGEREPLPAALLEYLRS